MENEAQVKESARLEEDIVKENAELKEENVKLTDEITQLKEKIICKRCGFDNNQENVTVDMSVLKDYYKAMIAQKVFEKEYDLFDGGVILHFEEPTRKLLTSYRKCYEHLTYDLAYYASDLIAMLTLKSVYIRKDTGIEKVFSWSFDDKLNFFNSVTYDNIETLFPEYYQNLSQIVLTAIRKTALVFNETCMKAADEVHDTNFWKGAGLN